VLVVRCNAWTASSLPFLNPRSLPISSTMVTLTVLRHSKDLQLASLTAFTSYLSSESIDACTRSSSSPFERCVCSDPASHIPCTCRMIPYMTAMLIRPIENIVYVCTYLICPSYICMCLLHLNNFLYFAVSGFQTINFWSNPPLTNHSCFSAESSPDDTQPALRHLTLLPGS
jgi:hypothetical protein